MDRAYSLLEIKAVKDDERVIEGIASTPSPDRMGDQVEPMGAKYALPMPLLWQHDASQPIGHVEFAKPTKDGIPFKARLVHPDSVTSETLKERLQLAWDSVKTGLVRAVSIGFRALEYSRLDDGGLKFLQWEWLELSAVTIPANAEATINVVKSMDLEARVKAGTLTPEAARKALGLSEIQANPEVKAAPGPKHRVVKLDDPARARAKPFVIRQIIRAR